jgi:hypothetical protein
VKPRLKPSSSDSNVAFRTSKCDPWFLHRVIKVRVRMMRRAWDVLGTHEKELNCEKHGNSRHHTHRNLVAGHDRAYPVNDDRLFEVFSSSQEGFYFPRSGSKHLGNTEGEKLANHENGQRDNYSRSRAERQNLEKTRGIPVDSALTARWERRHLHPASRIVPRRPQRGVLWESKEVSREG